MKHFKFFSFLVSFFLLVGLVNSSVYTGGDSAFSVDVSNQEAIVFNDDISTQFKLKVSNLDSFSQEFNIILPEVSGWEVVVDLDNFILETGDSKDLIVQMYSNSDFEYSESVVSDDFIKIGKRENYRGFFEFPIQIKGLGDSVALNFEVEIISKADLPLRVIPKISSTELSPISPLTYSIEAENLQTTTIADVIITLNGDVKNNFPTRFDESSNFKVFTESFDSSISPGVYNLEIKARVEGDSSSAQEWFLKEQVRVQEYRDIDDSKKSFSRNYIKDVAKIEVVNNGNVEDSYVLEVENSWFESMFFGVVSDEDYTDESGLVTIEVNLKQGEVKQIEYYYNFIPIYIILFVIVILGTYIYFRKASNPLDVETSIYEVKKDSHEGIKSLKVKVGFENIKAEEIEHIKMVFRMPAYLSVKDNSFLLAPPKHVLKGKSEFKLVWEFSRFEKNDSRILGLTLVNSKGILGDIKLQDLEFEVKINGRVRKYYGPFQTIKN